MRLAADRLNRIAALVLSLLFASAFPAAATGEPVRPALKAGVLTPAYIAPDFSLRSSNGSAVTLSHYRGKVVLLAFGFTNCAAVCPTTLATLAQARVGLGKAADSAQVIYVTVDPARDSVAKMREYLAAFDPSFIGASDTPAALAAVRQKYGVTAIRQGSGKDYAMVHTSSIFLIDPAGKLRAVMPYGHAAADFVHDIKLLSVR